MLRQKTVTNKQASDRASIRRRVKRLYDWFRQGNWAQCFSLVDPRLRKSSKIELASYAESLEAFKSYYGAVHVWQPIRISLHYEARKSKHEDRPFAYVYVVWHDARHAFHLFRERWVKDSAHWYTRVVGLVPHKELTVRTERLEKENKLLREIIESQLALARDDCENTDQLLKEIAERMKMLNIE